MFITQSRSVFFSPTAGAGPRELTEHLFMPRPVLNVMAGLSGYSAWFSASGGRPLGRLVVDMSSPSFVGNEVELSFSFGLRDWSGSWDDPFSGIIDYVVVAELEDDETVGDALTINGLEFTQAIQFFRSHLDLDPMNQHPDNSIPLVANKPMAVRVYMDYDPPDGIKDNDEYEGELEVESQLGTTLLTELFGAPRPGRDTSSMPISKTSVPYFVVPAEHCFGTVRIRGRVRVNRPPAALETGWSPYFATDLTFRSNNMPRVFLVGLNYLGDPDNLLDPAAPPPTEDEAQDKFGYMIDTFPTSGVTFTGFQVIDVPGPASGDQIIVSLADMKGDGDDLVYGLFSTDFSGESLIDQDGLHAGAARDDLGVAWSMAMPVTVAHEMGHLGYRGHAPGKEDTPDIDAFFPTYGSYPWGSIGQHGLNTSTHSTHLPQSTYDFMSYQQNVWISPYTYSGLMNWLTPPPGIMEAQGRRQLEETLFLSATISRDRTVKRHASFHYPAPPRLAPTRSVAFSVELADDCRERLVCWPLSPGMEPPYCWPKTFYAQIPYPAEAKWLLIWEGDTLLFEECIPALPRIDLNCRTTSFGLELDWASDPDEGVWYLVQRRDPSGRWRGLGPRTKETHAVVPAAVLGQPAAVRILATSGVATALATCEADLPPRAREIALTAHPLEPVTLRPGRSVGAGWRGIGYDESGRSIGGEADFLWFDDRGRQIHAGRLLPIERVPDDTGEITLVLRNQHGARGLASRTWSVQGIGRQRQFSDPHLSTSTPDGDVYPTNG